MWACSTPVGFSCCGQSRPWPYKILQVSEVRNLTIPWSGHAMRSSSLIEDVEKIARSRSVGWERIFLQMDMTGLWDSLWTWWEMTKSHYQWSFYTPVSTPPGRGGSSTGLRPKCFMRPICAGQAFVTPLACIIPMIYLCKNGWIRLLSVQVFCITGFNFIQKFFNMSIFFYLVMFRPLWTEVFMI